VNYLRKGILLSVVSFKSLSSRSIRFGFRTFGSITFRFGAFGSIAFRSAAFGSLAFGSARFRRDYSARSFREGSGASALCSSSVG
jgi:hypothetical protein